MSKTGFITYGHFSFLIEKIYTISDYIIFLPKESEPNSIALKFLDTIYSNIPCLILPFT